jgi:hypothetical protein
MKCPVCGKGMVASSEWRPEGNSWKVVWTCHDCTLQVTKSFVPTIPELEDLALKRMLEKKEK